MKNQILIPAYAGSKKDLNMSLKLTKSLKKYGYKSGLMLVIKDGIKGVTQEAKLQCSNLNEIKEDYGSDTIIVMLANFPLGEIDFLHNPSHAIHHVKSGINFLNNLPIGKRKILTFHLNSLVTEVEFLEKNAEDWMKRFDGIILPSLKEISQYSKRHNIEVKIETDPTPPFGDVHFKDQRTYIDVKLNELRSPFYITSYRGFDQIHNSGLGICLDLCHNRTIYELSKSENYKGILFDEDVDELNKRSLIDDVRALKQRDIVHLNDGLGIYSKTLKTNFKEGVALGKGDIKTLKEIIDYLIFSKTLCVLEINDEDFERREKTKESISFLGLMTK